MVIYPTQISKEDPEWRKAVALFQVLAIDNRLPLHKNGEVREYATKADQFLMRPMIYDENHRKVPAPYFSYAIRFTVSVVVIGSIQIDDQQQIDEFKWRLNAALNTSMTQASQRNFEAREKFTKSGRRSDEAMQAEWALRGREEALKADMHYDNIREQIMESRRNTGFCAASLCTHEEILTKLIERGEEILTAA